VYVQPEHRRRGVLRKLVDRARGWCRERGLTEMRLHNVGTRASTAAAWDSLGFEVVEQVRVLRLENVDASGTTNDYTDTSAPLHP
jgi:GNAT superfamily N-acetyltransferase